MKSINIYKEQTMTSLEIAELTGKQHKDVMKAIRNMEPAWLKVNGRKFALVEYQDKKGELRPCYLLTKIECLYIATKFNDEARAKLVLRWQQLELAEQERRQQLCLPSPQKILALADGAQRGPTLLCPSRRMAIFTASSSESKIYTPFSFSDFTASVIRYSAPSECWNRVCRAPGYTDEASPSWLMRFSRWNSGCCTTLYISPFLILINPNTGSLMILYPSIVTEKTLDRFT